jgi:hypothetical protein
MFHEHLLSYLDLARYEGEGGTYEDIGSDLTDMFGFAVAV